MKIESSIESFVKELGACREAIEWLRATKTTTLQAAWNNCPRGDWMLWLVKKTIENSHYRPDKKRLIRVAIEVANLSVKRHKDYHAAYTQSTKAIAAARQYLKNPTKENRHLAALAADAAFYAADNTNDAIDAVASAAASAADAAAYAAYTASSGTTYSAAANTETTATSAMASGVPSSVIAKIVRKHFPKPPKRILPK